MKSSESATASSSSMTTTKGKAKVGSNWKKLQKSLTHTSSADNVGQAVKRRRRSSSSSFSSTNIEKKERSSIAKVRKEAAAANMVRDSSSPAPTSLPWFAEDLNAEDLQLVRTNSSSTKESSSSAVPMEKHHQLGLLVDVEKQHVDGEAGKYVAIDCEMVGVGPKGSESVLARASIVNWHGAVLLDTFVRPREQVTDYRTWVSGVRPKDLIDAPSFLDVQTKVAKLIDGRILVGHAIQNDLNALLLSHPRWLIRDTATYAAARKLANSKFPSLRKLVALRLGVEIQQEGAPHSSVEDARATMALYRSFHAEWQQSLAHSTHAKVNKKRSTADGSSSRKAQIIGPGWKGKKQIVGKDESKARQSSGDDAEWWRSL